MWEGMRHGRRLFVPQLLLSTEDCSEIFCASLSPVYTYIFLQILCSVLGWGPEKQSQAWILSCDTSVQWSAAIGKSGEANE